MYVRQQLRDLIGDQTLIFGHRGSQVDAPMNTIPAFELSVQQGAHGIELDVHRSKDGHPIIVHDFTVDHTTNGSGLVTEKALAELRELDAGSWFSEKFQGTPIPTLGEVFEAVGQQLLINIEIKSQDVETDGVEQVVADCIQHYGMQERVWVSSFNPLVLHRFRQVMPTMPLGFLTALDTPIDTQAIAEQLQLTYEAVHPHHVMIDRELMDDAAAKQLLVGTWTVNDLDRAKELVELGVNVIITDTPDKLLAALRG